MADFLQNCLDGIATGAAYALLALGFTLIFGVLRRLNLSYGPSIMAGVFAGTALYMAFDAGLAEIAVATVIGAVVVGAYIERLCFWAIRKDMAVASMVSSFVIWMQIEEGVTLLFPDRTYAFPGILADAVVEFGPFFLRASSLAMLAIAALAVLGLLGLIYRTHFGLAVRAVSENPQAARVAGVNTGLVTLLAFACASALGGLAGFLIAAGDQQITPLFGLWATFKGLIAMMLGGMGSIPGAVLGGLLLGVVEANALWYLGVETRDLVAYMLLFAVLTFRPGGLMGQAALMARRAAESRV